MQIIVRKFTEQDIADKVRWVNDPANNRFLHYDLPLTQEGTAEWFRRTEADESRFDGVILADGVPCGLAGLLRIDRENQTAEFYIMTGEPAMKRQGIAYAAARLVLQKAFAELGLRRIYLYTETVNLPAQGLFEKRGFVREGLLPEDVRRADGSLADRYLYAILKEQD